MTGREPYRVVIGRLSGDRAYIVYATDGDEAVRVAVGQLLTAVRKINARNSKSMSAGAVVPWGPDSEDPKDYPVRSAQPFTVWASTPVALEKRWAERIYPEVAAALAAEGRSV